MRHPLRVVVVLSLLATAVVLAQAPAPAAPKPPGMDEMQVVSLKDAKWTPAKPPIPAGVMVSVIAADPAPGGSLAYVKFPAGGALAEHWHSAAEYTVVLSGHQRFTVEESRVTSGRVATSSSLPRPNTRRSASPAASAFSSPVEPDRPTTTG